MPRTFALLLALATLSVGARAQSTDAAGPGNTINNQQGAPIVRTGPVPLRSSITSSQPAAGVWFRADANSSVKTVSSAANKVELRVDRGRANVQVHHPMDHAQILVDMPGGQISLLKDGVYTFNAETNTVRVLRGEAEVYSSAASAKAVKIKEDHELTFAAGAPLKARDADGQDLASDLLPPEGRNGDGYRGGNGYGYGYAPYGDGYYPPYPAYGYGYPYGWGYPYGGYPYLGFGFGYYGGFRGGFRGRR